MTLNKRAALEAAQTAAIRAGKALRDGGAAFDGVVTAEGRDIKLKADKAAERLILDSLQKDFPSPVLSEESGWTAAPGDVAWVVDPLDGSANYNRGMPLSCVSIALVQDNTPILGVNYDFNHDDLYMGIVGEGATLNGAPMHVSRTAHTKDAILMTGLPLNRDFSDEALRDFAADFANWKKVRMIGTAATSLSFVAAGKADRYAEDGIQIWDIAAGAALVEAAGGRVTIEGDVLCEPIRVVADNGLLP